MYFAQRRLQALMLWRYCYGDALGLAVESALDAPSPSMLLTLTSLTFIFIW